ncbi:hypothetical protein Y032_0073g776 [Ancylostoma ceylanicum]|uniref:Uncharacterized protein n=1 Tax=Ancylostoma ceylanicum TaxID=53326 RepID=A0A016TVU3_9BILA|nr:hypothetical protein Y032_0073g776 [Ancylostoma ceylanicum]
MSFFSGFNCAVSTGFAEDSGGYGQDELRVGVAVDVSDSATSKGIVSAVVTPSYEHFLTYYFRKDVRGYSYENLKAVPTEIFVLDISLNFEVFRDDELIGSGETA